MLIGDPGTRKSAAIKLCKGIIEATGYDTFGANKTSKEKFLLDLEGVVEDGNGEEGSRNLAGRIASKASYNFSTEQNLWGDNPEFTSPREVFVCADEFNQFAGAGNIDFYDILGDLWDWDSHTTYKQRVKNSRSVSIFQPTVSILGGNTHENLSRAFPPEVVGQGIMSRLLLIHGVRTEKKIAFPSLPSQEKKEQLVQLLVEIRRKYNEEEIEITVEARELLAVIYESWNHLTDTRLSFYCQRRFTHLLKLCIITAAATFKEEVDVEVVVYANTMLTAVEFHMPLALGEFGRGKNSAVAHRVMNRLYKASRPLTIVDLWEDVHNDLERHSVLQEMLQGLVNAGRLQFIPGANGGFLPNQAVHKAGEFVDFKMLSKSEREGVVEE
jgi:hypothetical protein